MSVAALFVWRERKPPSFVVDTTSARRDLCSSLQEGMPHPDPVVETLTLAAVRGALR